MMEPYSTPKLPEKAPPAPLTWRDAAAPVLALALAALFWGVFSLDGLFVDEIWSVPGLGVPVFVCAYFAAVLVLLGKNARYNAASLGLMGASVALSVSCLLWCDDGMTIFNCFVILAVSATATFLLSGHAVSAQTPLLLAQAVEHTFFALFSRIPAPFEATKRATKGKDAAVGKLLAGVIAAVLLGAAVSALLASADAVFGSLVDFSKLDISHTVWSLLRTVILALFVCSGLFYIREPYTEPDRAKKERDKSALPWLVIAAVLDGIYALFCAVQLRYLFGGAENAAMAGGWAEYARTGFFQLVAVAVINLTVCLLSADGKRFSRKGGLILRIAEGLMLLLTAVILASAAYRMALYTKVFGLTVLRLSTVWCMLVLLAGLGLTGWKLYRPAFRVFPVFGAVALYSWCVFCLWGPSARSAEYNVDAYLSGKLETVDMDYLECRGGDAVRALRRLTEEDTRRDAEAERLLNRLYEQETSCSWAQYKTAYGR